MDYMMLQIPRHQIYSEIERLETLGTIDESQRQRLDKYVKHRTKYEDSVRVFTLEIKNLSDEELAERIHKIQRACRHGWDTWLAKRKSILQLERAAR